MWEVGWILPENSEQNCFREKANFYKKNNMGSILGMLKKGVKLATFETNLVHSAAEARKGYTYLEPTFSCQTHKPA